MEIITHTIEVERRLPAYSSREKTRQGHPQNHPCVGTTEGQGGETRPLQGWSPEPPDTVTGWIRHTLTHRHTPTHVQLLLRVQYSACLCGI